MSINSEISLLIIEDEAPALEMMEGIISNAFPNIRICGKATSVSEAIELINKHQPKIVVSDVEIDEGTCFDVFDGLSTKEFEVIFTTAYSEYAIQAIEHSASAYILKPFVPKEIISGIEKAIEKIEKGKYTDFESLKKYLENGDRKKLALKMKYGVVFVNVDDIILIEAQGSYSTFFMRNDEQHITSQNLGHYESKLPSSFFRNHNSQLVNLKYIQEIRHEEGGFIKLNNNKTALLSRNRKRELFEILGI